MNSYVNLQQNLENNLINPLQGLVEKCNKIIVKHDNIHCFDFSYYRNKDLNVTSVTDKYYPIKIRKEEIEFYKEPIRFSKEFLIEKSNEEQIQYILETMRKDKNEMLISDLLEVYCPKIKPNTIKDLECMLYDYKYYTGSDFKDLTLFICGNLEWYFQSHGVEGIFKDIDIITIKDEVNTMDFNKNILVDLTKVGNYFEKDKSKFYYNMNDVFLREVNLSVREEYDFKIVNRDMIWVFN